MRLHKPRHYVVNADRFMPRNTRRQVMAGFNFSPRLRGVRREKFPVGRFTHMLLWYASFRRVKLRSCNGTHEPSQTISGLSWPCERGGFQSIDTAGFTLGGRVDKQ